jgi:hypothetical protein
MEALNGKEAKKQPEHGDYRDLDLHIGRGHRSCPTSDSARGSGFGGDRWLHMASQKVF